MDPVLQILLLARFIRILVRFTGGRFQGHHLVIMVLGFLHSEDLKEFGGGAHAKSSGVGAL